jgi:hypothetical protein
MQVQTSLSPVLPSTALLTLLLLLLRLQAWLEKPVQALAAMD